MRGFVFLGVVLFFVLIMYLYSAFSTNNTSITYTITNLVFVIILITSVVLTQFYSGEAMSGYVFVGITVLCMSARVMFYGMPSISFALSDMMLITALIIPAIASGAISSERKKGTERLLSMLPISRADIVIGKYLALVCVFLIPVAFCGVLPLFLDLIGEVNFAASYAGLACYTLFGAALIAISVFCSTLFDKVWIGTLVNYGALVIVYALNTMARAWLPMGRVRDIIMSLSLFGRFDGFVYGIVDIGTVIFYAALSVIFVSLGIFVTEKRRLF